MAVTIQDIADKAGVSRGTVDRALNKRGRVNPEVEEKIEHIAAELGYVHKPRKRQKPRAAAIRIGVVTQLSAASFMLEINRGIQTAQKELGELGIEVLIRERETVREADQLEALDEVLAEGIQGLAIMPVDGEGVRAKLNQIIHEEKIPVITFNSDIVGTGRSCFVGMDNRRSGQVAAGLMGMLTRGAGKVLIVTGYFSSLLNNQRVDGFVEEVKRAFPQLEIAGVQGSFNNADELEKVIENAMLNISGINGVFVVSGGQEGIRSAFEKLRLKQRPYVVIYDQTPRNEELLRDGQVDFLIDQNGYEQGYRPLRLLAGMLQSGTEPERENYYTKIDIKTRYNL